MGKDKFFRITGKVTENNLRNLTIAILPKAKDPLKIIVNKYTVIAKAGKNAHCLRSKSEMQLPLVMK